MRPEAQAIVEHCKEFVRAMARAEEALGSMGTSLAKEERSEVVGSVLEWLGTSEVSGAYTREFARELIGQLSAAGMYSDYQGSTDAYIQ